jgi:hypothetical protein
MQNVESQDKAIPLAEEIKRNRVTGKPVHATLSVDDRVLARVTDGIYRTPASAFRELISNSYDADARSVVIETDAPRFERITIRDDGNGMTPDVLADLVNHIGGSAKRTSKGKQLHIVNFQDPDLSPGGRKLIGKIGIGLFSVSQLTQHFQIITKRKGDDFRTSADIVLRTYTEQLLGKADEHASFQTGEVLITSEKTSDPNAHGTELILMDLRQQTKDMLRSLDRWQAVEEAARAEPTTKNKGKQGSVVEPPKYHIGKVKKGDPDIYEIEPQVPWKSVDNPHKKFLKLFDAVGAEVKISRSNPNLQSALDNYLAMLWTLSLAAPLPYIDVSPFDLTGKSKLGYFLLSNMTKGGQAEPVIVHPGATVRDVFNLTVPNGDPLGGFIVVVDGIELRRPIRLDDTLHADSNIANPLLFVGSCNSGLEAVPATLGGGALTFEAYFYWNSKIIPKENIGVLVRINNASGTLFDKSFMNYQVSELTRLRQITAEIFVSQGLDPALNIDRESFNFSHPHYQFLTRWVHLAIRQVTNRLKSMAKEGKRGKQRDVGHKGIQKYALEIWKNKRGPDADTPPEVIIIDDNPKLETRGRERGAFVLRRKEIFNSKGKTTEYDAKVQALVTILDAYGLLEELSYAEIQHLVHDLTKLLFM